jgi:hypothetical protein
MKNIEKTFFFFILSSIFTFSGCSSSSESTSLIEDRTKIQQQTGKGILPSDHKVNELTMQVGNYSLTDLDEYYRNVLPQEKKQDYYNNARKMLISSMVESYGLLEKSDDKAIKYYLNELSDLKLMNPNIILKILVQAEKIMDHEEVRNKAIQIYAFNQKAIAEIEDPSPYVAKMGQKWEEIRLFSEKQS